MRRRRSQPRPDPAGELLYVVRAFRTVGLAIYESVWLIWFEGSGCDCLLMQAPSSRWFLQVLTLGLI
jgi:hypothetical protein